MDPTTVRPQAQRPVQQSVQQSSVARRSRWRERWARAGWLGGFGSVVAGAVPRVL